MKSTKNKNLLTRMGYFLLGLLFILVIFGQLKLVSAVSSRIVRVIVSWSEKAQNGTEVPKKLEFTTFLKDFVSPSPSTPPAPICAGVTVYDVADYGSTGFLLKPGYYTTGDDPNCITGGILDASGVPTGICNDTISSIKVGPNCILSGYADTNAATVDNQYGPPMLGMGLGFGVPNCSQNVFSDPTWDTYAQSRSSFCLDVPVLDVIDLNDAFSSILVTTKP